MATPVVFNGINYSVPAFGDVGYAQGPGNLSSYLIALASGTLQNVGGSFPLTAQVNFGTSFGLTALNFISVTSLPATSGIIRLAKTDTIDWRNNVNGANLPLGINGLDQLTFDGVVLSTPGTNGTVNAGIAQRVAFYPTSSNTVDDTTAFIVGTSGPNGIVVGTNTNDNASVGFVGEYIEFIASNLLVNNASGVYDDQGSISLSAGDWDIELICRLNQNGATVTDLNVGISTTPGNSSAGLVAGINLYTVPTSALTGQMAVIPPYRISLAAPSSVFWKENLIYSVATPRFTGKLSARRVR